MKLWIGDHMADAGHLTRADQGSCLLLMMAMWRTGGRLPNDPRRLAVLARCSLNEWEAEVSEAVMPLFAVSGGHITHARLTAELAVYKTKVQANKEAGKKGGQKKASNRKGLTLANASDPLENSLAKSSQPEPEPEEEKIEASASVGRGKAKAIDYPEAFLAAWKAYPHFKGRGSRPKAYAAWRQVVKAVGGEARLQSAVEKYRKEGSEPKRECGAKAFELWLADERYEAWLPAPQVALTPDKRALAEQRFRRTGEWDPAWGVKPLAEAARSWAETRFWETGEWHPEWGDRPKGGKFAWEDDHHNRSGDGSA